MARQPKKRPRWEAVALQFDGMNASRYIVRDQATKKKISTGRREVAAMVAAAPQALDLLEECQDKLDHFYRMLRSEHPLLERPMVLVQIETLLRQSKGYAV